MFQDNLICGSTSMCHKHEITSIQITQPSRCNSFTSPSTDVYVSVNTFRAPSRQLSGTNNCINNLWFYRWSVVVAALLVVVWPDHDQHRCYHHAPTLKPEAVNADVSSWWWVWRRPKRVERHINVRWWICETVASCWLIYLNFMMMHGPANVKKETISFVEEPAILRQRYPPPPSVLKVSFSKYILTLFSHIFHGFPVGHFMYTHTHTHISLCRAPLASGSQGMTALSYRTPVFVSDIPWHVPWPQKRWKWHSIYE
jgi:hypothetical protein